MKANSHIVFMSCFKPFSNDVLKILKFIFNCVSNTFPLKAKYYQKAILSVYGWSCHIVFNFSIVFHMYLNHSLFNHYLIDKLLCCSTDYSLMKR